MPVVAVVNRKGGSGKSTLATHLAAHFANRGAAVMLADIDRQQSTRTWLRQRKAATPEGSAIIGWSVDPRNFVRPPSSADMVVLDTPGGLTGLDLARVVMYADAILMPVCNSIFDRESAADCLAELRLLPRVVSGRCRIGAVGMRLDARTEAAGTVQVVGSRAAAAADCTVARVGCLCSLHRKGSDAVRCACRRGRGRPRAVETDPAMAAPGAGVAGERSGTDAAARNFGSARGQHGDGRRPCWRAGPQRPSSRVRCEL